MADRKPDDDDEDDLDDLDAAGDDEAPSDDGADDAEEGDFELEDEDEEKGGGLGRLIVIAGVAVAFIIGIAAGGYFFLRDGEAEAPEGTPVAAASEDGTAMTITRRRMMTAEELAQKGASEPDRSPPAAGAAAPSESALTPPPAAAPQTTAMAPAPAQSPTAAAVATPAPPAKGAAPKAAKGKSPTQGDPSGAGLVMPAVTAAAYREIPVLPQGKPLTGPIAGLIETTEAGQLPRAQGAQAVWKAYARPFDGPADKPKIAIIVTGMGLSRAATLAAINLLPGGVTLAFDPYAKNPDEWVGVGRSNGHEALLHLPMESNDFPVSDPGPLALLTDFDSTQNISRFHQVLASALGYVGVIQVMGSRFAASEAAMRPVLEDAKQRGLLFVAVPANNDDRGMPIATEIGLPAVAIDLKIDAVASAAAIDAQLSELEKIARERGRAVGVADAYPVTIAKIAAWEQSLSFKELALAPVSAVVTAPAPPRPAGKK